MRAGTAIIGGLLAVMASVPAFAQQDSGPRVTAEIATEERRRGIGWSDGDAVWGASLYVPLGAVSLDARAVSLRGAPRHGGADAAIDLTMGYHRETGPWRIGVTGGYHLFPGADGMGYGEIGGDAGLLVGPASIDLALRYAPRQSAIGGDNLYAGASASLGIPTTPFTFSANVGHSSGSTRDPVRSARLRPDGDYMDYGAAIDWRRGRWLARLRWSDTDASSATPHAGATVIGSFSVEL